ncbi:NAD(P)-binding protein [Penicillium taxi]|uniref:NAD(P)-binding protein n=1 Tax=Penicillium taxi TaxID=168475 RepID=UPI002545A1BE|nr:NAD(P)-binding protein [Penicillium taxi]KAJ5899381.1 NAD(P)-binding protein [Penicillium taxi]
MATPNVMIFGPSGQVGSYAALQAHASGAKVSLAMRDPSKSIPTLDDIPAERVHADLTDPATILSAVKQTGATRAFIYVMFGSPDNMRASIEALKEAGIEFVVLLSSFTIEGEASDVSSDKIIPFVHAQVEIGLQEVFGKEAFVTVRGAFFSSNSLWYKQGILSGEVLHANPGAEWDFIAPEDVGRVCGAILVNGAQEHAVGLVGPEKMSTEEAIGHIGRVLNRQIRIVKCSEQDAIEALVAGGMAILVAQWFTDSVLHDAGAFFVAPDYTAASGNVQKYTQSEPVGFLQWLEENKSKFD